MKMYFPLVLVVCLFAGSASFGQTTGSSDTANTNHKHALFLFNHYPRFYNPANSVSFTTLADKHIILPILFKPNYSEQVFLRLDYMPPVNSFNFPNMTRPDYIYHYDPTNPYGVINPLDGVVCGSLDYLLWKLFDDK